MTRLPTKIKTFVKFQEMIFCCLSYRYLIPPLFPDDLTYVGVFRIRIITTWIFHFTFDDVAVFLPLGRVKSVSELNCNYDNNLIAQIK
jgi:hypothetical protein